jgi:hypothetical protein
MLLPNQQLFDLKKQIETATPQQMALLQKKAEQQFEQTKKVSWWKSKTNTQKGLIIGGSILAISVAIYFIRKRRK